MCGAAVEEGGKAFIDGTLKGWGREAAVPWKLWHWEVCAAAAKEPEHGMN